LDVEKNWSRADFGRGKGLILKNTIESNQTACKKNGRNSQNENIRTKNPTPTEVQKITLIKI
jgi:hypothetical protein